MGKISLFLPLSVNISKTVPDTAKVTVMTNRKSNMYFRLTPRSMTLDDLELSNSVGISRDFACLGGPNS